MKVTKHLLEPDYTNRGERVERSPKFSRLFAFLAENFCSGVFWRISMF
jgi:hypothetical protein